jgi:hypothetical protein
MNTKSNIDWDAVMVSLSTLPQDKHADYFALITSGKDNLKQTTKTVKAKAAAIGAKVEKATSSKVQDKANKVKSTTRTKPPKKKTVAARTAKVNGVSISYQHYSMLQTVRELVANEVNGVEGLSSREIAEYRDCGEAGHDCSQNLDRLKALGLIGWRLVDIKESSTGQHNWPAQNLPSYSKRRQFVLLG